MIFFILSPIRELLKLHQIQLNVISHLPSSYKIFLAKGILVCEKFEITRFLLFLLCRYVDCVKCSDRIIMFILLSHHTLSMQSSLKSL